MPYFLVPSLKIKKFLRQDAQLQAVPDLVEIQISAYKKFIDKDLKKIFHEFSPVQDYTGKDLALSYSHYYLDTPKRTEEEARLNNQTYEAPLHVVVKLNNKKTGETKEQEIYFGEFPLMTNCGTFIINGVERTIIPQLLRAPGIYFLGTEFRERKLFGGLLIPNRGAWLEFETGSDSAIYVKIDRKRKVPVTTLLRAFGMESNNEIRKTFKENDIHPKFKYIEATLKKDVSESSEDAMVEIYKRLRPGDLATVDNAKSLFTGTFTRKDRYDLAEVGRFKLNQRLNQKTPTGEKWGLLQSSDLVLIIKEIIRLNNDPNSKSDDMDSLANRRLRTIAELLETTFRIGLMRMERAVKDRMSTIDNLIATPAHLVSPRPLMAVVQEFFSSNQLSQFMDQVNPLAELEHKRRVSSLGPGGLTKERAGFEVRDVHSSHYGRICPIETPEGPNIGLVGHLACYARINDFGFLETPYAEVKKGKLTGNIRYLDAYTETNYNIAPAGTPINEQGEITIDKIEARIKSEPGVAHKNSIHYMDISSQQILSVAAALIPFLEHDDANRSLMGSNMQRQAVPCVKPEAPIVSTGMEEKAAQDSGQVLKSEVDGEVVEVDARHIKIQPADKKIKPIIYNLSSFTRSNQFTRMYQKPIVDIDQKIKRGSVLSEGAATDKGVLALGQNLLVAFMSWYGYNFEDAIIISERLVKNDIFTSIHIEDFVSDIRDTKIGPEMHTSDIPNVSEAKLRDLDEEGIVRIGAEVRSGDILVGKISPKGEVELTAEERLVRAIFGEKARDVKDTSLYLEHGKSGRIISIKIFSREKGDKLEPAIIKRIQIEIAKLRKIMVGDKLAGRHGNKGVVAKILPEEDMPYLADGTPVDIVLNPLGVASRMNLGQILETHLGWAADKIGYRAIVPSLNGPTEEKIKQELKSAGLPEDGKVALYNGLTGELFSNKVTVGVIYMMKLNHLVEDKVHMRSVGPYSLITQQPLGGKARMGGQRFGEMEVWALEGYGAANTLQEMLTIKSDDVFGRGSTYDAIVRGEPIKHPNIPASFKVLINELRDMGLSIEILDDQEQTGAKTN